MLIKSLVLKGICNSDGRAPTIVGGRGFDSLQISFGIFKRIP